MPRPSCTTCSAAARHQHQMATSTRRLPALDQVPSSSARARAWPALMARRVRALAHPTPARGLALTTSPPSCADSSAALPLSLQTWSQAEDEQLRRLAVCLPSALTGADPDSVSDSSAPASPRERSRKRSGHPEWVEWAFSSWADVAADIDGRSEAQCIQRWQKLTHPESVKGPWCARPALPARTFLCAQRPLALRPPVSILHPPPYPLLLRQVGDGGRAAHRAGQPLRRQAVGPHRLDAARPHRQAMPRALVQQLGSHAEEGGVDGRGGRHHPAAACRARHALGRDRKVAARPLGQLGQEPLVLDLQPHPAPGA